MHEVGYIPPEGIEEDLGIEHYFSDKEFVRVMHLRPGRRAESHAHKYSHVSIGHGKSEVTVDGVETEYGADGKPYCVIIEAGKVHSVLALEPVTWFCIHATTERDLSKIDEVLIK